MHLHKVKQKLAFFNAASFFQRQSDELTLQLSTQLTVKPLCAIFTAKSNMILTVVTTVLKVVYIHNKPPCLIKWVSKQRTKQKGLSTKM